MNTLIKPLLTQLELDQLSINTIRFLSVDAVQKANSGHPGLPLGAAPMAYVLWTKFLQHNPANPQWFNQSNKGIWNPSTQGYSKPTRYYRFSVCPFAWQ